eukprot:CAMPEP_0170172694 /NCGR_PEP_ID=MMETSP0040_2-20121228/5960_1 /TAXON_ID=641309 /ORGANISM="Lotharella oceanica, Strain CCMP622" /LENGTH=121 /DNA_ID=CAMNT_0010413497 /DNA_START=292 /DNA_END=658 /DNA_ORIENTATION=-
MGKRKEQFEAKALAQQGDDKFSAEELTTVLQQMIQAEDEEDDVDDLPNKHQQKAVQDVLNSIAIMGRMHKKKKDEETGKETGQGLERRAVKEDVMLMKQEEEENQTAESLPGMYQVNLKHI